MFLRTSRISHKQRPFLFPARQTQRANYAAERKSAKPAQSSSQNRFNIMLEAGGGRAGGPRDRRGRDRKQFLFFVDAKKHPRIKACCVSASFGLLYAQ